MKPQRITTKFFVAPDPTAPVDLEPFIGLFHRFTQEGVLEGLLIDVADYAHVPEGPGVLLIGHEVDYGIDLNGGRAGLLTVRKRYGELGVADVLRDTLRRALGAVAAIEVAASLRFDTSAVSVQIFDRLEAPNTDAAFEAARVEVETIAFALYGDGFEMQREQADDPRRALSLRLASSGSTDAVSLLARIAD